MPAVSMRLGVEGGARLELLPERAHGAQLLAGEAAQEAGAHALEVRASRSVEEPAALGCELGEVTSGVALAALSLQEALALQAVDQSRQPAATEKHRVSELRHAH